MTLFILIFLFIVLIAAGMPIAFAVGFAGLCAIVYQGTPLVIIAQQMYMGLDSFILVAIPMFVLAGEIMSQGELTKCLTDLSGLLVGRIRGGLGHVNVLGSCFFAGITGSASADCAAIGAIMIPAMKERGYGAAYATALTVSAAVIGPIIPPSLTFIIYALAVGRTSIGAMFLGGILPGSLVGLCLMVVNYFTSKKRNYDERGCSYTWREIWIIAGRSVVILVMPLIVVVGVIGGVFTPTESAATAALYAAIISIFVFRTLSVKAIPKILFHTAKVNAMVYCLLATSYVLSYVLVTENIPEFSSVAIRSLTQNKYVFLLIINAILLVVGCVVDTFPAVVIFAPIFAPIAASYGIHPIHFGMVFCVNILIGTITPPVGSGLFLGVALGGVDFETLVKEVFPFLMIEVVAVLLITYIPMVTLFIPQLFGY